MFPEYVNKKLLCLIIFIVLGQVRQENLLARQVICMSRAWLFHTPGMVNRNTSRPIMFLNLKREADSTDVCQFNHTYKCTNNGSKAGKRAHRLYTCNGHIYKFYSSETILANMSQEFY